MAISRSVKLKKKEIMYFKCQKYLSLKKKKTKQNSDKCIFNVSVKLLPLNENVNLKKQQID